MYSDFVNVLSDVLLVLLIHLVKHQNLYNKKTVICSCCLSSHWMALTCQEDASLHHLQRMQPCLPVPAAYSCVPMHDWNTDTQQDMKGNLA